MANNYTQFSLVLNLQNTEEQDWWQKTLDAARDSEDADGGSQADFDYEVANQSVWFHDYGESGNLDHVADFVQGYLVKFRSDGFFVIESADTCSKPRVGEFGGSLVVVTAKKQYWFDRGAWVTSKTKGLVSLNGV